MKTRASSKWFFAKIDAIRTEAGHDAKKLEALSLDPTVEREARDLFPEDPDLFAQLKTAIELELPLARRGSLVDAGRRPMSRSPSCSESTEKPSGS